MDQIIQGSPPLPSYQSTANSCLCLVSFPSNSIVHINDKVNINMQNTVNDLSIVYNKNWVKLQIMSWRGL